MKGVDLADQLLWYKLNEHRQLKWWKIFFYLLEVSLCNACTVCRQLHGERSVEATKFRLAVVEGLLQNYERQMTKFSRRVSNPPTRLTERHFLTVNSAKTASGKPVKPDCVVCSDRDKTKGGRRHQTTTMCEQCKVPLCTYPCMKLYHTVIDYKATCTDNYHKAE